MPQSAHGDDAHDDAMAELLEVLHHGHAAGALRFGAPK